jgi:hypothetical protein
MPSKSSKKPATVSNSPPKPRRSGRKRARSSLDRSSLDATVAPPTKKVAMEKEAGQIEEEDETTGVNKSKGIK